MRVEEKDVIECSYNGDKYFAYNEAVLHTEKSYKLIDFEIKIEDSLAYRKGLMALLFRLQMVQRLTLFLQVAQYCHLNRRFCCNAFESTLSFSTTIDCFQYEGY